MLVKERIIGEAINLFNEFGISSVTMRQLAISLSMSPGNLTYHFKTKEELLKAIYEEIHLGSDDYILAERYITLHDFQKTMEKFYHLILKYQFFFNDLVYINRQFPKVAAMYEKSNLLRFKQARQLLEYYMESERILPENEHIDYDHLVHNLWMILTFWSAQQQVISLKNSYIKTTNPIEMGWQLIFPHLTIKGKEEYEQIKKFVKSDL